MTKTMKLGFLALMVAVLALAVGGSSMAFHEADELKCMSCHTMHASENGSAAGVTPTNGFDGAPAGGVTPGGNPFLLVDDSITDLCLGCHSEGGAASPFYDVDGDKAPHVMSASGTQVPALPGGDYYNSNLPHGISGIGARGHNPYYTAGGVSSLLMWDDKNLTDDRFPPGGSTTLGRWDCVACHAPHQNDVSTLYGTANPNFRMLWSQSAGQGSGPITITALEGNLTADESDLNHSAYRGNFSQWCAQCHGNYHNDNASNTIHPSGELLPSVMVSVYNSNPSPDPTARYSYLVPFEDPNAGTGDFDAPTNFPRVMCMSCHRAHASSTTAEAPNIDVYNDDPTLINNTRNITRWDMERASGSGLGCNKCHDKGD